MKKTLIAGAASLALAAMPVLGAFADTDPTGTTVTDNLEVTIQAACSFLRYGEAGAGSQTDVTTGPAWAGPTTAATADNDRLYTARDHKYSATLLPGADVELGTSHFTAYCNVPTGFSVTVNTPSLVSGSNSIAYSGSAVNTTSGQGWTLTKGSTLFDNTAGNAVFMSAATSTDENSAVTADATYNVYTKTDTPAGTYTGQVVYTFTYTDPTI